MRKGHQAPRASLISIAKANAVLTGLGVKQVAICDTVRRMLRTTESSATSAAPVRKLCTASNQRAPKATHADKLLGPICTDHALSTATIPVASTTKLVRVVAEDVVVDTNARDIIRVHLQVQFATWIAQRLAGRSALTTHTARVVFVSGGGERPRHAFAKVPSATRVAIVSIQTLVTRRSLQTHRGITTRSPCVHSAPATE